ncbi:MAG: hypothetical protein ACOC00_04195 [Halothiobacillaceae bacterium]
MRKQQTYVGLMEDEDGGLTEIGRVVMDARVFGLIDADQTCAGWNLGALQNLTDQVKARWDEYGALPSRLPDALRERHAAEYAAAIERARAAGWTADLSNED